MLKQSDNPSMIWPKDSSVASMAGSWWVLHTKSRNEKALAWDMSRKGISYFLPLAQKVTRKNGRTFRSMLPLFTGYVFFCGDDEQRTEVLRTNRVAATIPVINQEHFVAELAAIEKAIFTGEPMMAHPTIEPGKPCRVIAGPMMGVEGTVIENREGLRLVLQVETLGQSTSLEISRDMIELLEE